MYDVIVVGGGPAGVTAAIYAVRGGLKTAMIEKMYVGGQITSTHELVNYPGFPNGITGVDFAETLAQQADNIGVETIYETVQEMDLAADVKKIKTPKHIYETQTVIIASGASFKKLGLPNEEKFTGRGVSYCATCDGNFYKDQVVGIVGGGNNAVGEAIYLTKMCKKVYVIDRAEHLVATQKLIDMLESNPKVEIFHNSEVADVLGSDKITGVRLKDVQTGATQEIELAALFVAIGRSPDVGFLDPRCLDANGYIKTDDEMKVEYMNGVFAAGDVREKTLRQVATAVGDGAIAAHSAIEYLKGK